MSLASIKLSQYRHFYINIKTSSMLLKKRLIDKSYTKPCKAPERRPFNIPYIIRAIVIRNLEPSFASDFSLQKIYTLLNYDFDIALSNYDRFF